MRHSFRVSAPEPLQYATREAIAACYRSSSPTFRKCGAHLQGMMEGKVTISATALEIMDLTENNSDPLAGALKTITDVWFDVAMECKFDNPSIQQRLDPALGVFASKQPTASA